MVNNEEILQTIWNFIMTPGFYLIHYNNREGVTAMSLLGEIGDARTPEELYELIPHSFRSKEKSMVAGRNGEVIDFE